MTKAIRNCCVLAVAAIFLAGVSAWAMPEPQYLIQDNCMLTFGTAGNPLSAGTVLETTGSINRIVHWDVDQVAAWFSLTATANSAGTVSGGIGTLAFDTGTLTLTSGKNGTGIVLWTGEIHNLQIRSYVDYTTQFPAVYPRPAHADQPTTYQSVGDAVFTRTGGTWTDPRLVADWIGAYNMAYDEDMTMGIGNIQGRLSVPEPGSVLALLSGLIGMTGLVIRRRK